MEKGLKELKQELQNQNQSTNLNGLLKHFKDDIQDGKCDKELKEMQTHPQMQKSLATVKAWKFGY